MSRNMSKSCFIIAAVLFACSAYFAATDDSGDQALFITLPLGDVGERPVGESEVLIRVTNTSRRPREIINTAAG